MKSAAVWLARLQWLHARSAAFHRVHTGFSRGWPGGIVSPRAGPRRLPEWRRAWPWGCLALLCLLNSPAGAGEPPLLEANPETSREGYYQLEWSYEGDGAVDAYELQEAPDSGFEDPRTIYRGQDRATTMSGRDNGEYHYRVRAELAETGTTEWSEPVNVTVAHHSLMNAWLLFSLGGLVFLATVGVIVAGTRKEH